MKVQETHRFIVYRGATDAITVSEAAQAIGKMPNGWHLVGMENRTDGTTIFHVRQPEPADIK